MGATRRYRRRVHGSRSRRTLLVLPSIDDGAASTMKNALAIRNAASRAGVCPGCGVGVQVAELEPGFYKATFAHETGCIVTATIR
jgi:hypothetical protein